VRRSLRILRVFLVNLSVRGAGGVQGGTWGMTFVPLDQPDQVREAAPANLPAAAARAQAPGKAGAKATSRDLRLDFFRGIALFLIFIDHIPGNILGYFTIQSIGFSDAAEVFIFVSGYTAALVYGRALLKQGAIVATARIFYRAWQIYIAHIFIFLAYTALVAYDALSFGDRLFGKELRVAKFFSEPNIAVIRVLELRFQPAFLDILPLYIVLLGTFPLVLMLLRRHVLAALIPSLAIYVEAQLFALNLSGYPGFRPWFFSPFAWQLLFVVGAACGYPGARALVSGTVLNRLIIPAVLIVLVAGTIRLSWTIHHFWDAVPAIWLDQLWPVDKTMLVPIRLVDFLALAIVVVRFTQIDASFLRWRAVQPVIRCGQYSLQIFCLGVLLSVLGQFALAQGSNSVVAQLAVCALGIAIMIGTAKTISWYRAIDRATS
jgi:hypothetical protein